MNREVKKFIFSKRNILGEIAHWAVCQSPYHRPDNLEIVLDKFNQIIIAVPKFPELSYNEIRELLQELKEIPEFVAWNERKNGNQSQYKFTSRYDSEGNPDDDFIDLDALIRNVANSIVREGTERSIPEILGEPELTPSSPYQPK